MRKPKGIIKNITIERGGQREKADGCGVTSVNME